MRSVVEDLEYGFTMFQCLRNLRVGAGHFQHPC